MGQPQLVITAAAAATTTTTTTTTTAKRSLPANHRVPYTLRAFRHKPFSQLPYCKHR